MAPSAPTTEAPAPPGEIYDALAPIYDAVGGGPPFALLAAERLEQRLASRALPPDASLLDVGCGTGTVLLALRAQHPGWRLCGVDVSAGMLAMARRKPGPAGITWARARLPEPLPFGPRFDVVGSFYDTLNHLPDLGTLAATFQAIAAVMRPGALLAFDLTNAFGFETWWRERVTLDVDGRRIDTQLAYDRRTREARASIRLSAGAAPRRLLLRQRCFPEPEVRAALEEAGFRVEAAVPWSAVSPDSPSKTWFEATKKH